MPDSNEIADSMEQEADRNDEQSAAHDREADTLRDDAREVRSAGEDTDDSDSAES